VDVAAEPIELRDDDWAFQPADHLESRGKLRPALKRVSALASPDFGESIYDVAALGSGKPGDGSTLNQVPENQGIRHWLPVPASQSDHNQMRGLPNLQSTVGGVAAKTFFAHSHGGSRISRGG
jgi:hypothetical protein